MNKSESHVMSLFARPQLSKCPRGNAGYNFEAGEYLQLKSREDAQLRGEEHEGHYFYISASKMASPRPSLSSQSDVGKVVR